MNDQAKGLIITAFGVLAVVPDSLFIRLIDESTLTVIFWRSLIAAVVIWFLVIAIYRGRTVSTLRSMGWGGVQYAILMGLATAFFITGIQNTSVASALFITSTSPIFAALISWIFLGEKISKRMVYTIFFSLIGIAVIAYSSHDVTGRPSWIGNTSALLAALFLAACFTAARGAKHVSMVPATGVSYLLTAGIIYLVAAPQMLDQQDLIYMLVLAGFFVPIGTALLALGPRYITSAEVSLLILLEAVLAPILVWLVIGENPGQWVLVGGAIVIGVLTISNLIGLRKSGTSLVKVKPYQ